MTARAPVYIDSGKLHVFEDGDTLPPWLSPSSMAWENLTGVPAGITQLADLTGPGYAKLDAAGAWSVQAAIPQADVSGLTTALAGLQPLSARLTSIAGLTDAAGWLHDDGSGAWSISVPTKSDVGLSLVENTALSTWGGSTSLTTLGTVASGIWHGTAIADAYISSAATWNAKEGGLGNPSTSGYLLSSTSAGVRSWVAPYSLPTATASVLGGVKVGTGLAISSGALSVSYGTAAGTACVGNDSRLSNSRTPTAHVLDGALHTISGKTAGQVLVATGATTFGFATISGDAALSGAGALTLATLLTAGSAGSATTVPTLTWDAKGRLTAAGSAAISIPHTQINDWATSVSNVYLPLTGGTMTAGARILTLQDMTINTGANLNYVNAPFVAQRYTSDSTTTTHASIGFHNRGVNAAALYYSSQYAQFYYNDYLGGVYHLWDSKDFASQAITNWTTAYNWGNHASAGYLLSSTAAGTYLPIGGTASNASALGGVAADKFVQGNDSRLSDSRTPTAHALDGALHTISGKTAGQALVATSATAFGFVTISGDATLSGAGALTLASLLTAGSVGSATTVPAISWDTKGRLTAVGIINISIPHTQISDWGTATSSFLTANQPISLTGAVTGSGTTPIPTSFANTHLAGINQDLTTTSGPTFAAIAASNSYYGVFGTLTADAQKWYLVATVDLSAQYGYASAVIRFNSVGGNGALGLGGLWAGSCFIRAKQMSAMSNGLDNFTIGWNYCHGFNPSGAVIGVKTTDNASHKIVNIYLLCPASYDGMSWQIDNLAGSITASGVGTNYVTTLPTGLATYTGSSAIWSDWKNITVPGASTFTGLITANGGISGKLTGHASLDIPLTGSSAITGSLISSNASNLGSASLPWGSVYGTTLYEGGVALSSKYLSTTYSGSLSLYGLTLNNGGLSVQGVSSFTNKVTITDDLTANRIKSWTITPRSTDSYALGGTTLYWYGTYTNRLFCAIDLNAPSTATDVGIAGQIVFGSSYIYVCTATNTWRRAALATW